MRVQVTGVAGFIGFHLAKRLPGAGYLVYGIDNLMLVTTQNRKARLAVPRRDLNSPFQLLDLAEALDLTGLLPGAIVTRQISLARSFRATKVTILQGQTVVREPSTGGPGSSQ